MFLCPPISKSTIGDLYQNKTKALTQTQTQMSLLHIPSDMWTEISSLLMPHEVVAVSKTCTQLHKEMARPIQRMTESFESVMNRYDLTWMEPKSQRMHEVTFHAEYNPGYTPTPINVRVWRNAAGQIHRMGGLPAIIHPDGSEEYYEMGYRHRENDKPALIWGTYARNDRKSKRKEWWTRGKLNRENGLPAVMCDWYVMSWYVNGELHREIEEGPACITEEYYDYYLHGVEQPQPRNMRMGDISAYEMDQFFVDPFFDCNKGGSDSDSGDSDSDSDSD
jgi:hypothetical protein